MILEIIHLDVIELTNDVHFKGSSVKTRFQLNETLNFINSGGKCNSVQLVTITDMI